MTTMPKTLINSGPSRRGWHRLESFAKCPQLFAWKYKTAWLSDDGTAANPLVRGRLGHVFLAHHYARLREAQRGGNPEKYFLPMEALEIAAEEHGLKGAAFLPTVRITVGEYLSHYAVEEFEILHVEEEFSTVLRDLRPARHPRLLDPETGGRRCEFTMRPDLIARDASKRVFIFDHKLVTKMDTRTSQRYTHSGQFLGLQNLGRMLFGDAFRGAVVNCLQAAPHCRFQRYPVDAAPFQLSKFVSNCLDLEEAIAFLEDDGRAPSEWPAVMSEQVCMTAYGPCPAFDLCRYGVQGDY